MLALSVLLTILLPALLGTVAMYRLCPFRSRKGLAAAGVTVGLMVFTWLNFLTAQSGGITWTSIIVALILQSLLTWIFRKQSPIPDTLSQDIMPGTIQLGLVALCIFAGLIFSKIFTADANGLHTHRWLGGSDLSTHLSMISSFAFGNKMLPDNPYYSGVPLFYPYLPNFYAALIWFTSGNMELALKLPGIIFGIVSVILIFEWTLHLTHSAQAAFLAPILFLFNGSLGWLYGLDHFATQNWDKNIFLVNHIQSLLNQRSLIVGLPLFILILSLWQTHTQQVHPRKLYLTAAITGLLPMIHAHSMLCLFFFLMVYTIASRPRELIGPLLTIGLLWLPQVLFLAGILSPQIPTTETLSHQFLKFHPGWMATENLFWFWIKNTSLWIPLGLGSLFLLRKNRQLLLLNLAGWLIFILANLFDFAPYTWDNTKLFFYWLLALTPAIAVAIIPHRKSLLWITPAVLLILNLTGFFDVNRYLFSKPDFNFFDTEDLSLGNWIRENTPKNSIFVLFPKRNNPLIVSGRRAFLGASNMEMFGLKSKDRFIENMLMGRGKPEAKALIEHFGINYFLLGPEEKNLGFNEDFMKAMGPKVFETQNVQVFKIETPK